MKSGNWCNIKQLMIVNLQGTVSVHSSLLMVFLVKNFLVASIYLLTGFLPGQKKKTRTWLTFTAPTDHYVWLTVLCQTIRGHLAYFFSLPLCKVVVCLDECPRWYPSPWEEQDVAANFFGSTSQISLGFASHKLLAVYFSVNYSVVLNWQTAKFTCKLLSINQKRQFLTEYFAISGLQHENSS